MVSAKPQKKLVYAFDPETGEKKLPFAWQTEFHRCENRFKGFSGPVGSGKSRALCAEALKVAYINVGRVGVIGAPTYPMLRDSTRASFIEVLEENQIPYRAHKSENSIYLYEVKSTVLFRALDSFERIRGTNLAWFGVDELTYCKEESWLRLEARLRDPKAKRLCGFGSWTPKGHDWVYQRFIGHKALPGYKAFFAKQNPTLGDYYERLQASYDPRFYEQEALGEYLNVHLGRAYYPFSREEHIRMFPYMPRHPLWWALDFNRNPMSSVIGQTINETILVLDELSLPNSNTLAACEEFLERTKDYEGQPLNLYVYGDATGEAHRTSSLRTDWQIVKDFISRYPERFHAQFRVPSANPTQRDRVNCVNARLMNYAKKARLFLSPKCEELAIDLEQVGWKTDAAKNVLADLDKSDPMRTHLSDALGYLIAREFPMRRKAGERDGPPLL